MSSLAGSFLVARPILKDPNFHQTVVFLLQHDRDGACGVVINRPAQVEGVPFPVYIGGPCQAPGLFMLHGHPEWAKSADDEEADEPTVRELASGIYIGDAACLEQAAKPVSGRPARFRILRGYAGWGPGQLERELASGAWAVMPATAQLLFDTPFEDLWDRLLPSGIPQPSMN
jgi:putative transcriptional regulator